LNNRANAPRVEPDALPLGVNSAVLRLLATGVPLLAIPERLSKRRAPGFSVVDLRAVLTHARSVARETSLLPPAEAAFFGRHLLPPAGGFDGTPGVELSASDLDALRSRALDLIDKYLSDTRTATDEPEPQGDPMDSAALQYAEALLRQEEVISDLRRASADEASLHARITGTDRARFEELLLNRGGTRLDFLVDMWSRFVRAVETEPESLGYEEYENWLSARDVLEDVISLLSPSARQTIETYVRPLDHSMFEATREAASSIRPRAPWQPQRWWWYRVPSPMGQYFKQRLEHVAPAVAQQLLADESWQQP
jgi:hypothetical protein